MKKPQLYYWLLGLAGVILIIVVVASWPGSPEMESTPNSTSTPNEEVAGETPNNNLPPANPPTSGNQNPKPVASTPSSASINITSPALDGRFNIGQLNSIKWSKESGLTSGLYLVDATNGATLGWITPTITAHQTSYTWDAKDVALNRQGGVKKSVVPGKYYMKMKFDGPISEATSNTFYILYPEQDTTFTHNLQIQNFKFSPASIAVRIGEKITIQNKDSRVYTLTPKKSGDTITLAPGETKTITTGSFAEGENGFYSQEHSATNLSVDIYK